MLAIVGVLLAALVVGAGQDDAPQNDPGTAGSAGPQADPPSTRAARSPHGRPPGSRAPSKPRAATSPTPPVPSAEQGREGIFGSNRFLVAYYGTAGTGSLGVLGETTAEEMVIRLDRAARAFRAPGRPVQPVFELIVTIADGVPGPDGDYAHDLPRDQVRRYIRAAHEHHALLLLDVQPGRTAFDVAVRRWAWALEDPSVGLAIDPEWRMHAGQVPGQTIGSVDSTEINRTSLWLSRLQERHRLPQKLFVIHQFRRDMVLRIQNVVPRDNLAMVQHVDGFGTPAQKLDTYAAVARPRQFVMGFKLFYDEDVNRMGPAQVHRIRPTVRFVSCQ